MPGPVAYQPQAVSQFKMLIRRNRRQAGAGCASKKTRASQYHYEHHRQHRKVGHEFNE